MSTSETDGSDAGPTVTFTGNNTDSNENGWNLVGNPFAAPIDWESISPNTTNIDATVYVWDANSNGGDGGYVTYTEGEADTDARVIAPFQTFFVKANEDDPNLPITSNDKEINVDDPPALQQTVTRPGLTLELRATDGSRAETASVRFSPDANSGKDRFDAYQLGSFATEYAQVAFTMEETDALFTHRHLPLPDTQVELNLDLDITAEADYELAAKRLEDIPADWNVTLEDKDTGAFYNLREGEYPTFTSPTTDASNTVADSNQEAADPSTAHHPTPTVASAAETNSGDLPNLRLHVGPEAPLPVELSEFTASVDQETATLAWETASESNNAGFYVEHRASDADDYSDYTFVEGAGTTDEPQTYQIAIDDLELGVHTFRLRQVDTDGTTTHHDPVEAEVTLAEPYRVDAPYPNPAHAQATLGFAVQEAQSVTVTLYDVVGRRVQTLYEDTPTPDRLETLQVPVSTLSSGAYFVRVQGEGFTETKRLTVVR